MKMQRKLFYKLVAAIMCVSMLLFADCHKVKAEVFYLNGGRQFDSTFYSAYYPDLKAKYGNNTQKLLQHYLDYGIFEGRIPSAIYLNNMDLLAIGDIVPKELLYNRKELRKKCDEAEFYNAYDEAYHKIVKPIHGMKRIDQLNYITYQISTIVNSSVPYSIKAYHYNDPCGVFSCRQVDTNGNLVHPLGASCAGVTRATGLCLNMLAIPYEHVNANTWKHQWCRVNINGVYYICDPYLGYVGVEPAPYRHPLVP